MQQANTDPFQTIVLNRQADDQATTPRRNGLRTLLLTAAAAGLIALVLLVLSGLLASNGADASGTKPAARARTSTPTTIPPPTAVPTTAPAPAALAAPPALAAATTSATIAIVTSSEDWLFDTPALEVAGGGEVAATFDNRSSQRHNWVLVSGGDDVAAAVNLAAAEAGRDNDYLPSDTTHIVTSIPLLKGGVQATVSFTAPAPGNYTFLCTVPGHYDTGMSGTLTVR
jgi:azurin